MQRRNKSYKNEPENLEKLHVPNIISRVSVSQLQTPVALSTTDFLEFYLNGEKVIIQNPDPRTTLIEYLRTPEINLTGAKTGCEEGGCGTCTVMVSSWDDKRQKALHRSVNACLLSLCSLAGKAITTVEGLGSVKQSIHPLQYEIIRHNGSQCGYCTPGWVMALYSLFTQNAGKGLTTQAILEELDGNLCRCTGYRPIFAAAQTFSNNNESDLALKTDEVFIDSRIAKLPQTHLTSRVFVESLKQLPIALQFQHNEFRWYRPVILKDLISLQSKFPDPKIAQFVAGNTGTGIIKHLLSKPPIENTKLGPLITIDISSVYELNDIELTPEGLYIGGAITLTTLIEYLENNSETYNDSGLVELKRALLQIGNTQIRNVASLAGNLILVLQKMDSAEPFISDLFTILGVLQVKITVSSPGWHDLRHFNLSEITNYFRSSESHTTNLLIVSIFLPATNIRDHIGYWRVGRRQENAISLVNGGFRITFDIKGRITAAQVIFAGLSSPIFRAEQTEKNLLGCELSIKTLQDSLAILKEEIEALVSLGNSTLKAQLVAGILPAYCRTLALNLFYKFFISLHPEELVDEELNSFYGQSSNSQINWKLEFSTKPSIYPLTQPYISYSNLSQATGEALYLDDIPIPSNGLVGQFVYSVRALGRFHYVFHGESMVDSLADKWHLFITHLRESFPGFVDLITVRDIPNQQYKLIGYGYDYPIFCEREVIAYGQPLALSVATSIKVAKQAALYIQNYCVVYEPLNNEEGCPREPLFSLHNAINLQLENVIMPNPPSRNPSLLHLERVERRGESAAWLDDPTKQLVNCQVIGGVQSTGPQTHFYLETQVAQATPQENQTIKVFASTQSPNRMHQWISDVLGLPRSSVSIETYRIGGGFGGKTTQSWLTAVAASVGAWKLNRPVRLKLNREDDAVMIGKRHPFLGRYWIAFEKTGIIRGLRTDLLVDAGSAYDNAPVTLNVAMLAADNAYKIDNFQISGQLYRTNKPCNTSMRGFGAFQSIVIQEEAIEHAAHELQMLPESIRELNLYNDANVNSDIIETTPYGQILEDCTIQAVFSELKSNSNFEQRVEAVSEFNRRHRWRKRGISLMPLKYGKGFEARTPNQGDAYIEVYASDGSILVHTGGVDIGQGFNATIALLVAQTLNIPIELIRVAQLNTEVIANSSTSGADSTLLLNGNAVIDACKLLRGRLEEYCQKICQEKGEVHCVEIGINYWDYQTGWNITNRDNTVHSGNVRKSIWHNIIKNAYADRVGLSAHIHFELPGISEITNEEPNGTPYLCFTYSASAVEVEIDVLTGEYTILRADILHDLGNAANASAVMGQIEGGFMQGVGALTIEEVVYQKYGPDAGRNITTNTSTYKIPSRSTIPRDLRISLYSPPHRAQNNITDSHYRFKPTGQTGVLLAIPVLFAIKHAILAARADRGLHDWFELDAPATAQKIQSACTTNIESEALIEPFTDGDF